MPPNKIYSNITKITYTIKKYYFTIFHVDNDKGNNIINTCNNFIWSLQKNNDSDVIFTVNKIKNLVI